MVTLYAFTCLVAVVAVQRLAEVRRSRRHHHALLARGGREHAQWQVPMLAVLHTSWLVAMLVEVWWRRPEFHGSLAAIALVAFGVGQALRLAAMATLGPRWTIAIVTLPGTPAVARGLYCYVRHPNYLGVVLEIGALPLVHTAVWTAAIWSALNAVALWIRIRTENAALAEAERTASSPHTP